MRPRRWAGTFLSMALVATACAAGNGSAGTEAPVAPTTGAPRLTTTTTTTTTTMPATTTTAAPIDWGAVIDSWRVSLRAVGPYQIGMSLNEAMRAGGAELFEVEGDDPSCSYYTHDASTGLDRELRFMVRADRIVRIDIDGSQLKTLSGVGVGDTTAAVVSTYGDAVIVSTSHTGDPADAYITYLPFDDADADFRLRFETTDDVVTTYRIGRLPEVEWVDRCE